MNRRTIRRIALGAVLVATVAGMTALWFQSRSVDVDAHGAYDSSLRDARRLDRTLNQDVLSARFNLVHSYDGLADTEAEVEAMAARLTEVPAFLAESDRARLLSDVEAYREVLGEKLDRIERFKGHNSILRNSLRYLPTAAERLNARITSADPSSPITFQVLAVLRMVLVYNLTADESLHDEIAAGVAALDAESRAAFPAPEWRPLFGNFIRHTETITREKPAVDELVGSVLESPIAEHEATLASAYQNGYGAATAQAEVYRLGLYGLSVALLALVVFAFWQLTRANATLEQRVASRTAELSRRNGEMQLVFDNMEEALLTLEPNGVPVAERSARAREWFGPPVADKPFCDTLGEVDPRVGPWFKLGWESLREGFLPPELCLEQMPKTFVRDGRHFRFKYRPIDSTTEGRVLLIATDMTEEIDRLRAERGQREIVSAFSHSSRDKSGFLEFLDECERLAARVVFSASMTELRRDVHTLKGVSALFGVETVAARCHELESQIDETGKGLTDEDCRSVATLWSDYRARIEPLLGDHRDRIEISTGDLDRAIIEAEGSSPTLATRMREWRKEPIARRFERAADQLKQLAVRLGKAEPIVSIEANGVRLERDEFASFWASLAHVLRNAVDHGLETEHERVEANKPAQGRVTLGANEQNGELVIEVCDDGAGIDWDRLVGRARTRTTLSQDEERARLEALFAEGVSSRDEVTAFSGRGVGMGAIKSVTEALGGRLEVQSARGQGTVVRCIFSRVPHSRAA